MNGLVHYNLPADTVETQAVIDKLLADMSSSWQSLEVYALFEDILEPFGAILENG